MGMRTRIRRALLVYALLLPGCEDDPNAGPNWEVEADAKATAEHPLGGFWKSESCAPDFGLAIGPMEAGKYYVSFCGPGGCFAKGTYRPVTSIYGDDKYRVESKDAIEVAGADGFSKYVRCPGRAVKKPS